MSRFVMTLALVGAMSAVAAAQYKAVEHRTELKEGEVAVTEPGTYAEAGKTYVLTKDISSETSPIVLGNNVTLDLNGYTMTYTAGKYEHVPNYSFEEGLKGWDVSQAPNAKVRETRWTNPMDGEKGVLLPKGETIISPYITLPVAERAYYAMALVSSHQAEVKVAVQNEKGQDVTVVYKLSGKDRPGVPVTATTKLGGGAIMGLFHGQPAGKYRVLVTAVNRDVVIDSVDIRPGLDVGVGVVGRIRPFAYHRGLMDGDLPGFFHLSSDPLNLSAKPKEGVPAIAGEGTVTIRNGVIQSGFEAAWTTALQCTAGGVKLKIDNVKFVAAGLNTNEIGRASCRERV